MLTEITMAFLPLLVQCTCQSTVFGLDNTQQLSPTFRLDWTVILTAGDIVRIQDNDTGSFFTSTTRRKL